MTITAWKINSDDEGIKYNAQVSGLTKRSKNKVIKSFDNWNLHGEGFNHKNNKYILMFNKTFDSYEDWGNWASEFPYDLYEITSHNNVKKVN